MLMSFHCRLFGFLAVNGFVRLDGEGNDTKVLHPRHFQANFTKKEGKCEKEAKGLRDFAFKSLKSFPCNYHLMQHSIFLLV